MQKNLIEEIEKSFPGLIQYPVRKLNEGFQGIIWESYNGILMKVGKSYYSPKLRIEYEVLSSVNGEVGGLIVPKPLGFVEVLNQHILLYRKIEGITGSPIFFGDFTDNQLDAYSDKLAKFIAEFKNLDISTNQFPSYPLQKDNLNKIFLGIENKLSRLFSPAEIELIERFQGDLVKYLGKHLESKFLIHSDLWYGNQIFNQKKELIGIIDFGEVSIGDPIIDITLQAYFSEDFMNQTFIKYLQTNPEIRSSIDIVKCKQYIFGLRELISLNTQQLKHLDPDSIPKIRKYILDKK